MVELKIYTFMYNNIAIAMTSYARPSPVTLSHCYIRVDADAVAADGGLRSPAASR